MNMIEKVDLTKAYYLQHLITEHYQECMDEWYKKCKSKKDKEVEMKKVEKYIREVIKANGELSTTYKHSKDSNNSLHGIPTRFTGIIGFASRTVYYTHHRNELL